MDCDADRNRLHPRWIDKPHNMIAPWGMCREIVASGVSRGQLEQLCEWTLFVQRQQSTLECELEHRFPLRSGLFC